MVHLHTVSYACPLDYAGTSIPDNLIDDDGATDLATAIASLEELDTLDVSGEDNAPKSIEFCCQQPS